MAAHCSSATKISLLPGTDSDNDAAHAELARIHECDSVQVAQTVSTTSLTTQSLQLGVTYIRNVWPFLKNRLPLLSEADVRVGEKVEFPFQPGQFRRSDASKKADSTTRRGTPRSCRRRACH